MADARLQVIIDAVDNTSKQIKTVQDSIKHIGTELTTAGRNMTLFGAAVTGSLGLAAKAAFDQQAVIARLDQALKNVGRSYSAVQKDVDGATAAIERNTNYSKSQTFGAITSLVAITGNYDQAMRALQPTLDLATAKQLDLESASFVVGRALAGQLGNLDRYGISVRQDATETEILSAITKTFGGQAEAAVNPMVQLKNSMSDLAVTVGQALIPVVTTASSILRSFIAGIKELPGPIQTALPVIAGAGVAILGLGTALLFVGQTLKIVGPAIALLTNPLALVVAALGVLTVAWFANWGGMRDFHARVINSMRQGLADYVNSAIRDINLLISGVNVLIKGLNLVKIGKDVPLIPKIDLVVEAKDAAKEFKDFSDSVTAPLKTFTAAMDRLKGEANDVRVSLGGIDTSLGDVRDTMSGATDTFADARLELFHFFEVTKHGFGTFNDVATAAAETMRRTGVTFAEAMNVETVKALNAAKGELDKLLASLEEGQALAKAFAEAGTSVGDAWQIAMKGVLDGTFKMKPLSDAVKNAASAFDEMGNSAIFAANSVTIATQQMSVMPSVVDKSKDALQHFFDVTIGSNSFLAMNRLMRDTAELVKRTGMQWKDALAFGITGAMNTAEDTLTKFLDTLKEGPDLAKQFAMAGTSVGDAWAIAMKGVSDGIYHVKEAMRGMSAGIGTQTDLDLIKNADMLPSSLFNSLVTSFSQHYAGGLEKLQAFQAGSKDKDIRDFITMIADQVREYFRTLPGTGGTVGSPLADRTPMPRGGGIPSITIQLDGQVVGQYLGSNMLRSEQVRSS